MIDRSNNSRKLRSIFELRERVKGRIKHSKAQANQSARSLEQENSSYGEFRVDLIMNIHSPYFVNYCVLWHSKNYQTLGSNFIQNGETSVNLFLC